MTKTFWITAEAIDGDTNKSELLITLWYNIPHKIHTSQICNLGHEHDMVEFKCKKQGGVIIEADTTEDSSSVLEYVEWVIGRKLKIGDLIKCKIECNDNPDIE